MKLYNTLSRKKEPFTSLEEGLVKMYTCGHTVYGQPHIGNWLPYIYWDILARTLRANGYKVQHTQNITDVGHLTDDGDHGEDKMEKGARKHGKTAWDVAKQYTEITIHEAEELLALERPTHLVPATSLIAEQIAFVESLERAGHTYIIEGDGIYFDTSTIKDYGKLARLDIEGLRAGARVEATGKRNSTDFAVWKFSPKDTKRDMEWDSPWGLGFPGWHLECSVIARQTLGDTIDIHCGGIDHIPVHHSNEIAQTEAVTKQPFSTFWIHNNHIKLNGTKISKSLGNCITLQDCIDKGYSAMAYKLAVLSKHYRTEGNFSWDTIEAAQNRLHHWENLAALRWQTPRKVDDSTDDTIDCTPSHAAAYAALQDDIDTPNALVAYESIHKQLSEARNHDALLQHFTDIEQKLGIKVLSTTPDISEEQRAYIKERETARANKDWGRADELRDLLVESGIYIKDDPKGTIWQPNP